MELSKEETIGALKFLEASTEPGAPLRRVIKHAIGYLSDAQRCVVTLSGTDTVRIPAIKALREILGITLKDAKEQLDEGPVVLVKGFREDLEELAREYSEDHPDAIFEVKPA